MTSRGLSRPCLALLFAAAFLPIAAARADTIELGYPEEAGVDQTPGHFVFDFLRAAEMVVNDSGLSAHWVPLPPQRLLHQLTRQQPNFCIAGAGITAERAKIGKFTLPFYEDRMVAVIALAARHATLDKARSLEDLIQLNDTTFLGYVGLNYGTEVSARIDQLGSRMQSAPRNTAQMLDMLERDRADFALLPYQYAVNLLALRPDREHFIVRSYPDMHRDFHTAFLCTKPVSEHVIDTLNAAIRREQPGIDARFGDRPPR